MARDAVLGYDVAFWDRLPSGSRMIDVDAPRDLPGMIELVEYTGAQERVSRNIDRGRRLGRR